MEDNWRYNLVVWFAKKQYSLERESDGFPESASEFKPKETYTITDQIALAFSLVVYVGCVGIARLSKFLVKQLGRLSVNSSNGEGEKR